VTTGRAAGPGRARRCRVRPLRLALAGLLAVGAVAGCGSGTGPAGILRSPPLHRPRRRLRPNARRCPRPRPRAVRPDLAGCQATVRRYGRRSGRAGDRGQVSHAVEEADPGDPRRIRRTALVVDTRAPGRPSWCRSAVRWTSPPRHCCGRCSTRWSPPPDPGRGGPVRGDVRRARATTLTAVRRRLASRHATLALRDPSPAVVRRCCVRDGAHLRDRDQPGRRAPGCWTTPPVHGRRPAGPTGSRRELSPAGVRPW
jgi:hypothetical protein